MGFGVEITLFNMIYIYILWQVWLIKVYSNEISHPEIPTKVCEEERKHDKTCI